jgi:hypothetical protein
MNYETIEYKNCKIRIEYDEDRESPREWSNVGTMVCFHKRYNLGDGDCGLDPTDFEDFDDLYGFLERRHDAAVILPLYIYDHGGITMRTSPFNCRWDSGQVGFIYASHDTIRKEYGDGPDSLERAEKCLRGEVEVYDTYLRGDVYGYVAEDQNGDEIASCWGYYGDDGVKEAIELAKAYIDCALKKGSPCVTA